MKLTFKQDHVCAGWTVSISDSAHFASFHPGENNNVYASLSSPAGKHYTATLAWNMNLDRYVVYHVRALLAPTRARTSVQRQIAANGPVGRSVCRAMHYAVMNCQLFVAQGVF